MRLTADLIAKSPQYTNPLKEREVDLRGHKIPEVENLGVLEDGFDSVDISDNEVTVLGNFPAMPRLKAVIAHNNKIEKIAVGLYQALPGLESLAMHNNQLKELKQLEPLCDIPSLQRLSLVGNVVTRQPDYRLFVISKLPNLKQLDFKRVRPAEREAAYKKFGKGSKTPSAAIPQPSISEAEKERIANLIRNAKSLDEIKRIEEQELPPVH